LIYRGISAIIQFVEIPQFLAKPDQHEAPVAPPSDPFLDVLPLLLSSETPERPEPTFHEISENAQTRYTELMQQRTLLESEGKFATGTNVAIFVSDIGVAETPTYFDGIEEPLLTLSYEYSPEEYQEHQAAAEGLVHRIKQITGGVISVEIHSATNESIHAVLDDPNVAHMIYIGHANESAVATGIEDNFGWQDPEAPLNHLKASFGVFGCSAGHEDGPHPRVGSACFVRCAG